MTNVYDSLLPTIFRESAVDPPPPFPMSTLWLESPFAPRHSWTCSVVSFLSALVHTLPCTPNALLLGLLRHFKTLPLSFRHKHPESAVGVIGPHPTPTRDLGNPPWTCLRIAPPLSDAKAES